MLADFYIPRLSRGMNIVLQKSHLGVQILYRSVDPAKNGVLDILPFLLK